MIRRGRTTTPAEPVRIVPVDYLLRASRQVKQGRLHPAQPGEQVVRRVALENLTLTLQRETGTSAVDAKEVLIPQVHVHPAQVVATHRARDAVLRRAHHLPVHAEKVPGILVTLARGRLYMRLKLIRIGGPHQLIPLCRLQERPYHSQMHRQVPLKPAPRTDMVVSSPACSRRGMATQAIEKKPQHGQQ